MEYVSYRKTTSFQNLNQNSIAGFKKLSIKNFTLVDNSDNNTL